MPKANRDRAASKCMQEVPIPGWIKTIEQVLDTLAGDSGERLPMPHKWMDVIYYTTLGTGMYPCCVHRFPDTYPETLLGAGYVSKLLCFCGCWLCVMVHTHDHHVQSHNGWLFFFEFVMARTLASVPNTYPNMVK